MLRSQTRPRTLSALVAAAATLLCLAPSAFAQDQPPPANAVPPPMQAMAAPKGSDDMTGSLGFGVGVVAGTSLVTIQPAVTVKYWLSDVLAIVPSFDFNVTKPNPPNGMPPVTDTRWRFNPSVVVLFVPFRSTSTRLSVGGGLGIGLSKNPPADTGVRIFVPIQAGLEHFFTRWFSMGIAATSNLFDYQKNISFTSTIDSTNFIGSLLFYTD